MDETIYELLVDIRDILKAIHTALTGLPYPTPYPSTPTAIDPTDFVYERRASTLSNPVPAGAKKYKLIEWNEPERLGKTFYLVGLGSDQHDNSYYYWLVDGRELPISGEARAGTIYEPFIFPRPIKVVRRIVFMVDNNNDKAYPNPGGEPEDKIPYEGMFFGFWERG